MPSRKAPTAPAPDELPPRDFVFCGQVRVTGGGLGIEVRLLDAKGQPEEKSRIFKTKRKSYMAVGGVYTGAKFSETQALGLDNARYQRMLGSEHKADILEWEARQSEARQEEELLRLEKDQVRRSQISRCVQPLAAVYDAMRSRGDHQGCMALERAMILALRKGSC